MLVGFWELGGDGLSPTGQRGFDFVCQTGTGLSGRGESKAVQCRDGPFPWAPDPACPRKATAPLPGNSLLPAAPVPEISSNTTGTIVFPPEVTDFISPDARRDTLRNQNVNRYTSLGKARKNPQRGKRSISSRAGKWIVALLTWSSPKQLMVISVSVWMYSGCFSHLAHLVPHDFAVPRAKCCVKSLVRCVDVQRFYRPGPGLVPVPAVLCYGACVVPLSEGEHCFSSPLIAVSALV